MHRGGTAAVHVFTRRPHQTAEATTGEGNYGDIMSTATLMTCHVLPHRLQITPPSWTAAQSCMHTNTDTWTASPDKLQEQHPASTCSTPQTLSPCYRNIISRMGIPIQVNVLSLYFYAGCCPFSDLKEFQVRGVLLSRHHLSQHL